METVNKKSKSPADRRLFLRESLWPDVPEEQLWLRKRRVGFTTIPRTLPLVGQIMDQLSGKGFPLFGTYLTLWCWVFDEGIVEIRNNKELAYESGFSGPRAEATWRSRMRKIEELGFIKSKPGLWGDFQYVLILNPLRIIKEIYKDRPKDVVYNALIGRLSQIGADDFDV